MGVARRLLKDWTHDGLTTLLHWRGSWMEWQFTHWVEVEEGAIRSQVYARLEKAVFFIDPRRKKNRKSRRHWPIWRSLGFRTAARSAMSWRP